MNNGLYIGNQFVSFAEAKGQPNIKQIASRGTVAGFQSFDAVLPNPDPILKKMGKDIAVYKDLKSEAGVKGCLRRRKSAVKSKAWRIVQGEASKEVTERITAIFNKLQLNKITGAMVDASYYGYRPMEIRWANIDGAWVPADVVGMPPEWYFFDKENKLRFKHKDHGTDGLLLELNSYLLPTQDASYDNPYGEPDAASIFWPTTFKMGGFEFWVRFTEKYGSPWVIGKYGNNYDEQKQETLLNNLYAMVQDAVAVIPDNSKIEIIEAAGKTGSADVYERFLMFCRSEVNIALLGQNQSTESSSTKASASAGIQVADDIADGDCEMVAEQYQQLIDMIVSYNWSGPSPQFEYFEESNGGIEQAERDGMLNNAGAYFTKQYFMNNYGIKDEELSEFPISPLPAAQPDVSFAEYTPIAKPTDYAAAHVDQLASGADPVLRGWVSRIQSVINSETDLQKLPDLILAEFAELPMGDLVEVMAMALSAAELEGRSEVKNGG